MNKKTALTFFGIITAGLGISYYTLKGPGNKTPVTEDSEKPAATETAKETPPSPAKETASTPNAPVKESAPGAPPKPDASTPVPAKTVEGEFKSPEAAMTALGEKIGKKDFVGFADLLGPGAISDSIREEVKALVESPDLKLDPAKPHVEISKSADGLRWAFNFVPVSGTGAASQLYADLKDVPDQMVDVSKISLPLSLSATRATDSAGKPVAPRDPANPTVPKPAAEAADALTVAHAFSTAVIRRDFNTARELADPSTVTDERVAALMIAVEEGKFALKQDRPFVVTLAREDITWVLARVESGSMASEFAVELGQIDSAWKVNGLTFSKVLSALSEAAGAGDVAYSPIIDDPEGGDSLVLYFEFDDEGLTPRTERQLAIVAEILNQGDERVIRINGHADAKGSDDYNVGLSDRRAESIRQALIGRGVKPDQVVTEAFGAAKPRKPNFLPDGSDNPSGRSANRRAEVLLDF